MLHLNEDKRFSSKCLISLSLNFQQIGTKKMCERLHLHLRPPDGIFRIGSARRTVGGANLEVTYGFAVAEEEDTAK